MRLRSSTDRRRRTRKIATMMARPTATSAAATAITKNTMAWPSTLPWRRPNATSARFAAFSISSIDMKITSGLRRTTTPITPIENSAAERAVYHHDRARVDDDLGRGEKLRAQRQVEDGHAPEVHDEEERAVDRVLLEDQPERRRDGEPRHHHEGHDRHHGWRRAGIGIGDRGRPSVPAGSSDS